MISLDREVSRAHRSLSGAMVLAFIDVDGLKDVNDAGGHAAGDQLLKSVADGLRTGLRGADLVFRYGGDEFVCVLPESDLGGAQARLQHIHGEIAKRFGHDVFSIGLAALREGETAEQLCARADGALYAERRIRRGADRLRAGDLVVIEGAAAG
jgi:diguanylate cyclase (GGDEF)-like protein